MLFLASLLDRGIVFYERSVLILQSTPFICKKLPLVIPVVCQNIPSIGFNKKLPGFTLIELIITLTIAGILLAIAGPAMRDIILDQRLTTQSNDFIADLNLARSEAIRRASNVTVCRQGGSLASPSCNSSANWHAGRVIFVDTNGNSTIDSGEEVLRVRESLDGNNTLNVVGSVTLNSIILAASGLTTLTTGQEGALRFCDNRGTVAMTISINYTGRASSARSSVSSCP